MLYKQKLSKDETAGYVAAALDYPVEKSEVIEEELSLCGYFVIVTSEKMTAKEAVELYKSRDASEKLFRGDKSYLGNKYLRVYSDESASARRPSYQKRRIEEGRTTESDS